MTLIGASDALGYSPVATDGPLAADQRKSAKCRESAIALRRGCSTDGPLISMCRYRVFSQGRYGMAAVSGACIMVRDMR